MSEPASFQVGDGSFTTRNTPQSIGSDLSWMKVSAGAFHTCGLDAPGELYCWGLNSSGQLGDGTTFQVGSPKWIR